MDKSLMDGHKLHLWPKDVAEWLWGDKPPGPITMEVSLTNRCNQKCSFCAFDYEKTRYDLDPDILKTFLSEGFSFGLRGVTLAGEGEPLMWGPPLRELTDIKALRFGLMTNGIILKPALWDELNDSFEWIRFSISALDHDLYVRLHGATNGEGLFDNLQYVCENKGNTTIGVQCLLAHNSASEWSDVIDLAQRVVGLGIDYFTVKPYSQHPKSINKGPQDYDQTMLTELEERLSRVCGPKLIFRRFSFGRCAATHTRRPYRRCRAAPFFHVMASDGHIYPCAQFIGDPNWRLGNMYVQSFRDFHFSQHRKSLLLNLRHEFDCINCRLPCRLDAGNEYLHEVYNSKTAHRAFI